MLWPEIQHSSGQLHSRALWSRLGFAPLNVYLDFLAAVSSLLPNLIKNLAAV